MDISSEKPLSKIGNAFILTILLSQRVKELRAGAKPLVQTDSKNPVDIAFEEIRAGKYTYKFPKEPNE